MSRRSFDYAAAMDVYLAGELTLREIGEQFGVTGSLIHKIATRAGLKRRPPPRRSVKRKPRAYVLAAVELVRGGATFSEAAEELGVSRNSVAGACFRAGLSAPITAEKRHRVSERQSDSARERWAKSRAEREGSAR